MVAAGPSWPMAIGAAGLVAPGAFSLKLRVLASAPGSGCVRQSTADAAWPYAWAAVGDAAVVVP